MKRKKSEDESLNNAGGTINITSGVNYMHTGDANFNIGTTTTSSTFTLQFYKELVDTKFIENEEGNFIEITYKETQNYGGMTTVIYTGYPTQSMIKEIYGVIKGKLQLIKAIRGIERPGYYVAPSVEWEE